MNSLKYSVYLEELPVLKEILKEAEPEDIQDLTIKNINGRILAQEVYVNFPDIEATVVSVVFDDGEARHLKSNIYNRTLFDIVTSKIYNVNKIKYIILTHITKVTNDTNWYWVMVYKIPAHTNLQKIFSDYIDDIRQEIRNKLGEV